MTGASSLCVETLQGESIFMDERPVYNETFPFDDEPILTPTEVKTFCSLIFSTSRRVGIGPDDIIEEIRSAIGRQWCVKCDSPISKNEPFKEDGLRKWWFWHERCYPKEEDVR
jgi:hypothetical protein